MSWKGSVNMFAGALEKYKEHNLGCLPQRIAIYWDGVENKQIPYVCEYEVATLNVWCVCLSYVHTVGDKCYVLMESDARE
jgi:hypothetical protein